MENQRTSCLIFNRYYNHLADVFVRFCLTIGPLNPALLSEYVPRLHIERQLVYLGLTFNARYLFHHLVGGLCIFQCDFCAIVTQFPSRSHGRNCSNYREHRRSHRSHRRSHRRSHPLQTRSEQFNMPPLSIIPVCGIQVIARLSTTNSCTLINVLRQFVPSDVYHTELLIKLLSLLPLNGLSYHTLNRRFTRHLANL